MITAIIIDPDSLLDEIHVDREQAEAWYASHKENYYSPLRIRINAVDIDPDELAGEISMEEADVRRAYEERLSEFALPEQRRARHILIKNRTGAQQTVEAVKARLAAGEDFADVARETSEDSGSAEKGGDLGWVKQGIWYRSSSRPCSRWPRAIPAM